MCNYVKYSIKCKSIGNKQCRVTGWVNFSGVSYCIDYVGEWNCPSRKSTIRKLYQIVFGTEQGFDSYMSNCKVEINSPLIYLVPIAFGLYIIGYALLIML